MNAKTKDDAIRVLFETVGLIEILWNQMIAFETVLVYKNQAK